MKKFALLIKKLFGKKQDFETASQGFSINTQIAEAMPENEQSEEATLTSEIFEWLDIIIIAIISVVIVFTLIFRIATITGTSMQSTLFETEKVVITNFNYTAKNGDIVVISRNAENTVEAQQNASSPIIKRVIAVAGQTVDIDFKKGIVYVDGKKLNEPYISTPTTNKHDIDFPVYVPEGYIFVLGDNRAVSLDSRDSRIGENGLIDTRYILGHAVFRIYPIDRIGRLN